jgi:hypothetical protein
MSTSKGPPSVPFVIKSRRHAIVSTLAARAAERAQAMLDTHPGTRRASPVQPSEQALLDTPSDIRGQQKTWKDGKDAKDGKDYKDGEGHHVDYVERELNIANSARAQAALYYEPVIIADKPETTSRSIKPVVLFACPPVV